MRKQRIAIAKMKKLEYVSVGEKVESIKSIREVKGWTSSSKQQVYPPERTKTKGETRLERTKIKLKRSALESDYLVLQAQLKPFMYVDLSLRGDPKKDNLIAELNFTKRMQLKRIQKSKFFVGITDKQKKFIIHLEFMVANHKITYKFIQNLKSNPNKVHDLTIEIKISLKKQILEKSIKLQIHKITRITDNNSKTDYHGSTYATN